MTVGIPLLSVGMMVTTLAIYSSIIVDNVLYLLSDRGGDSRIVKNWKTLGITTACAATIIICNLYATLPQVQSSWEAFSGMTSQALYITGGLMIHNKITTPMLMMAMRAGKRQVGQESMDHKSE